MDYKTYKNGDLGVDLLCGLPHYIVCLATKTWEILTVLICKTRNMLFFNQWPWTMENII